MNENNVIRKTMREKLEEINGTHPNALYFLNITDGLEALDVLRSMGIDEGRIRYSCIQSTHFEQKNSDAPLNRLGADLLMELALGTVCVIVDYGTDKELSRAVYQGVPFIKYALERNWFEKKPTEVLIHPRLESAPPRDTAKDFSRWYHNLDRRTKQYLRHFKLYANGTNAIVSHGTDIKLIGVSAATDHDGHPEYYSALVEEAHVGRKR